MIAPLSPSSINWLRVPHLIISPLSLSATWGYASPLLPPLRVQTPIIPRALPVYLAPYMSPRPILKPRLELPTEEPLVEPFPFATCPSLLLTRHVHFPPTPTLTSTFTTHSSSAYDRTPVVVAPNTCALPGRHERELFIDNNTSGYERRESESSSDTAYSQTRKSAPKGSYFHPRAYEACAPEPCPSPLWSSPDSDSSSSDSPISTPTDDELDVASHRSMSMLYAPTNPASCTSPPSRHNMNAPMIPPNSYLSPEGPTSSYSNYHHPQSSPSTKERKAGKRSSNENNQPRNPKGSRKEAVFKLDHQQRSSFTFPSLDFEGCLGGF